MQLALVDDAHSFAFGSCDGLGRHLRHKEQVMVD